MPVPGMTAAAPLRLAATYAAPATRVFAAWLDPGFASRWLFATATRPVARVELEARVGGRFCLVERDRGRERVWRGAYVAIDPFSRLAFTLELDGATPAVTRVEVTLADTNGACELQLVHDDLPRAQRAPLHQRWAGMLYGLGTLLDAGGDIPPLQGAST